MTPTTTTATLDTIDLHVRSYRSALKSTLEVTINSLSNSHLKMQPILHPLGDDASQVDTAAFVYSLLRLPVCIDRTRKLVVGQIPDIFVQSGFGNVDTWPRVTAPARRRTMHYQSSHRILATFCASISDIDDITNLLIAYQTEWNKFHLILKTHFPTYLSLKKALHNSTFLDQVNLSPEDWLALTTALGAHWRLRLRRIYRAKADLRLQLLAGSWVDYTKATQKWWKNIAKTVQEQFHISHRSIYFVSSNTHSLLNLITGFALHHQTQIIAHLKAKEPELYAYWTTIQSGDSLITASDFLYFASKYYLSDPTNYQSFVAYQQSINLITVPSSHYLDINTQITPVSSLIKSKYLDPRLKISRPQKIAQSDALIFNIDYPLGFAAYHILSEAMANIYKLKGLYIMGKAAVLNGEIGDIQVPRLVFDEHTQNSYIFKNCFNTFFPFVNNQGSILTNQKSVSVLGTFLENEALLDTYSKNNLTVIEMESGPYLNAVTEATYDQQTPKNTIIDLNNCPFDLGIINYTSDTPYSKAKNLGTKHLTLDGVEPVYLASLAILQRIINLEEQDL